MSLSEVNCHWVRLIVVAGKVNCRYSPTPQLELWQVNDSEPEVIASTALPGVCVDGIAWAKQDESEIVCVSGMRSQESGFLSFIDTTSIRLNRFLELNFAMVRRIECTETLILLAHGSEVVALRQEDGSEAWVHQSDAELLDFAHDPDMPQLFLTNGELIHTRDGKTVEHFPALPDCCCVAARPEGGFVGVSTQGIIGIWNIGD